MGQAREIAERFFNTFSAGDVDAADDCFAEDCAFVVPAGPLTKPEHRALGEAFKAALPDSRMEVINAVEGDGEVYLEGRYLGTQTGDFVTPDGTLPASGRSIDLPFADYFKVRDGKIVEHRTYWDQATMMTQLGAMG